MEVNLLIDESEIYDYLGEAKKLILDGKFRIALNSNRLTNLSLFDEYLINEESVKSILLNLTVYDFCEKVQNKHADSGNLKITNLDRLIFTKNGELTI